MSLFEKINTKIEHRKLINQYGKRRKGAIIATQRATQGYEFEEKPVRPGLLKRFSSLIL